MGCTGSSAISPGRPPLIKVVNGRGIVAKGPYKQSVLDMSISDIGLPPTRPAKDIMLIPGFKELDYKHEDINDLLQEVLEEQVFSG